MNPRSVKFRRHLTLIFDLESYFRIFFDNSKTTVRFSCNFIRQCILVGYVSYMYMTLTSDLWSCEYSSAQVCAPRSQFNWLLYSFSRPTDTTQASPWEYPIAITARQTPRRYGRCRMIRARNTHQSRSSVHGPRNSSPAAGRISSSELSIHRPRFATTDRATGFHGWAKSTTALRSERCAPAAAVTGAIWISNVIVKPLAFSANVTEKATQRQESISFTLLQRPGFRCRQAMPTC